MTYTSTAVFYLTQAVLLCFEIPEHDMYFVPLCEYTAGYVDSNKYGFQNAKLLS